jgi:hypothetical protein
MCRDSPTLRPLQTGSSYSPQTGTSYPIQTGTSYSNQTGSQYSNMYQNQNVIPDQQPQPCPGPEDFQQQIENDPQIAQMIDQIIQSIPENACGVRPPQHRREVIRRPSRCPPRTATIRRRLPSPEGDTVERVTVISQPQDRVNIIIEKPGMPPPCYSQREEQDNPLPPIVTRNVVCVQSRSNCLPNGGGGMQPYDDGSGQQQPVYNYSSAGLGQQPIYNYGTNIMATGVVRTMPSSTYQTQQFGQFQQQPLYSQQYSGIQQQQPLYSQQYSSIQQQQPYVMSNMMSQWPQTSQMRTQQYQQPFATAMPQYQPSYQPIASQQFGQQQFGQLGSNLSQSRIMPQTQMPYQQPQTMFAR